MESTSILLDVVHLLFCCRSNRGASKVVQHLIEHGADVNSEDHFYGGSALCVATRCSDEATVRIVIAHGANVDHGDLDNSTPFFGAVDSDNISIVQALLLNTMQRLMWLPKLEARDARQKMTLSVLS